MTNATGIPAAEINARAQAYSDAQPVREKCLFCRWTFIGPAATGRARALAHRADKHPEARQTRRRRGSLTRFNASNDGWREEGNARAAEVAAMLAKRRDAA